MKSRKGRFAVRLSLKSTLLTSLIFIIAIAVITYKGADISLKSSLDYSTIILKNSISKLENSIKSTELIGHSITSTVETIDRLNTRIDTSSYFSFLTEKLKGTSNILGVGVFYLPYEYDKNEEHAGIYVNSTIFTGKTENEWDDNKKLESDNWDYFDAEWYKLAIENKTASWAKPIYEYTFFKDSVFLTAYVEPVKDKNGKIIGVTDVDLSLEWLQKELIDMKPYPESNIILIDKSGNIICNPLSDHPYEGNIGSDKFHEENGLNKEELDSSDWKVREEGIKVAKVNSAKGRMYCLRGEMYNGWQMIIMNRERDTFANLNNICLMVIIIAILGLAFLFFANRIVVFKASKPLVDFADAAKLIARGNFDVPIPEVKTDDEISDLSMALNFMQTSITDYIDRLTNATSEKERMAGELNVAKTIQMQMLQKFFDSPDGCGIYASSIPSKQVGGDLYDIYVNGDDLYYIIADVSGKGVPAALLMSISISAFRASIRYHHSMSEIANIINNVFCGSNEDNMFITVNLGHINVKTGEAEICNCGHNPIIIISPTGDANYLKIDNNIACGVLPDFKYKSNTINIEHGSRLLLYTDGVTEAETKSHDQYGEDRLIDFARFYSTGTVNSDEVVIKDLIASVNKFVDGAEQSDDITIMSITI